MTTEWPIRKLDELSDISYGYTEKAAAEPIGPKFLRITDIQNGAVDWSSVPYCKIDKDENAKHQLRDGDIVFARTGATTGKSYMIARPPDAVCASYLIRLRLLRSSETLPKFVSYYFGTKAYWDAISTGISGSAQGGFNASKLGSLGIPVPPIAEQQRVVAILDEAFAGLTTAIANVEKNLKNTHELFDSYLNSVFASAERWFRSPLGELTTKIGSGATPTGGEKSYKKHGVPLIRSLNVHDRRFKIDDLAFLDDAQAKKLEGVTVQSGDVLLNITGASVARCCLAPDSFLPARVNQHVSIIRPIQSTVLPRFLEFGLTAKANKDRLLGVGESAGATRQAITKAQIQEFLFSFPPLEVQRALIEKFSAVGAETEGLETRYAEKLKSLADLKQSILQKAFSGELTSPPSSAIKEAAE